MAIGISNAPIPLQDAIARPGRSGFSDDAPDPLAGTITDAWIEYFNRVVTQLSSTPFRVNSVAAVTQAASIAATDFSGGGLSSGYYRLTYYARITRAATTSSSLTVTFDWVESGVSLALSGSAMTGNTVTTVQSGTTLILADSNSPIRYSTTYASVGGTTMQYRLSVVLEQVQA